MIVLSFCKKVLQNKMHISEGVLSAPVLAAGASFSAGGVCLGLKRMDYDRIPFVAILTSTFFVASLIHIPLGPSSIHLILNGLLGLILGWSVFPAILVALTLQAILFQFGGLTVLGVNTFTMAFPAIFCYYIFTPAVRGENPKLAIFGAFLAGAVSVFLSGLLVGTALVFTGSSFIVAAKAIVVAHIPIMIIEGIITASVIAFLRRVKPEVLRIRSQKTV
ncbi:cobalt transporter CbiM [Candidatus Desulfofervidus auxilii]|uniref:Cobalt transporter CbiM n=2 Tax=Desulfofervidus auxilii TaxID=1621989 RepID=A0A7U4QIF9_DESA2|nr:cobalt transporter CbiM [Candidatus Desulfofervidus auxilii]AMM39962.1 cobalt transporter CbiM [Candidatus Desulfofervidus auxilii]